MAATPHPSLAPAFKHCGGLRAMVKDAVDCYLDETMQAPKIIRLHFVRDEVLD
jgi:hypothetical protein